MGGLFFPDSLRLYYAYFLHCFPDVPTVLTRGVCLTVRPLLHNDHVCCCCSRDLNVFLKGKPRDYLLVSKSEEFIRISSTVLSQ